MMRYVHCLHTNHKNCYKIIAGKYLRGMLTFFVGYCIRGYVLISLIIFLCTGYAYRVNQRRKDNDPDKRNYRPLSVLLAFLFGPIILFFMASLFILRALAYGFFLILFMVALVVVRKPIFIDRLNKIAAKVGNLFLKINTFLINSILPKPQPRIT